MKQTFSTFEINKVIRRRSIKAIMKGFNFSCTQATNFFRCHAVDKARAEHLHMSRTECSNYDFENLYLA